MIRIEFTEQLFIKSPSGRKRFNVLGALNAVTLETITFTNESYIKAESVCELMRKLAASGLGIPITIICDNARYQKCAIVFEVAEELGIQSITLFKLSRRKVVKRKIKVVLPIDDLRSVGDHRIFRLFGFGKDDRRWVES